MNLAKPNLHRHRWPALLGVIVQTGKPRLSAMVLLTTWAGALCAHQTASWVVWSAALLGTTLLVLSANTFNAVIEADLDAKMHRTQNRPIPAGKISISMACWAAAIEAVIGTSLLSIFCTPSTALLAGLSWVVYIAIYTPMKQTSAWALLVGAVPGALPPMIGYVAIEQSVDDFAIFLFILMFVWQLPHFLAISLYLRQDYRRGAYKVASLVLGVDRTIRWTILTTILTGLTATLYTQSLAAWYPMMVTVLSGAFIFASLKAPGTPTNLWARRTFIASLIYLSLLFPIFILGRIADLS